MSESVFVPVITLIRFTTFGFASIASTPVPCTEYTVGDPAALCVIVKLPVVSPVAVGVNVTSNTWLPPGIIVTGNVFGVNVNCPSDDTMFDITRSLVPGLLTVDCSNKFDPITTLPKSRFGGVIVNVASTPVPCTEYTVGDPAALCVIVKLPVVSPVAVGVNVTSNIWLPPGIIVTGNVFGVNVNCPSDDTMFDITRSLVPGLLTVD